MPITTSQVKLRYKRTVVTPAAGETPEVTTIDYPVLCDIKSFPDLGAAPAVIEVTTLSDKCQKFMPGIKGMAAMEFLANYDKDEFAAISDLENSEQTYYMVFSDESEYKFSGRHSVLIVGGGLNAAVDMKVIISPSSEIVESTDYYNKVHNITTS